MTILSLLPPHPRPTNLSHWNPCVCVFTSALTCPHKDRRHHLRCHLKDSEANDSVITGNTPNPRCHRRLEMLMSMKDAELSVIISVYFGIFCDLRAKRMGAASYTHYAIYAQRAENALGIYNLQLKCTWSLMLAWTTRLHVLWGKKSNAVSAQPRSNFLSAAVISECIPLHPALLLWEEWPGNSGAHSQRNSMDPS